MPQHSAPVYNDPLDVLRRFAPTPFKAVYRIGSHRATVQTNDIALFPALPLEVDTISPGTNDLEWKLIRDSDVPGLLTPPVVLNCGALTIVEMGTPCLIAFDHERKELLGFIGADVDGPTHQEFLVPFLCRIINEAPSSRANEMATTPFSGNGR